MQFVKMSGSGNDFIIIDNRENIMEGRDLPEFVRLICRRGLSVGADGLIFIENSDRADFAWRFFNSDGSEVEMCGNGSRCASRYAYEKGFAGKNLTFDTKVGIVESEITDSRVKVKMPDPTDLRLDFNIEIDKNELQVSSVRVGVPHVVYNVYNLENYNVKEMGSKIRNYSAFQPEGTNVNFIFPMSANQVMIRTYERGVENETLACGTGCIAAAVVTAAQGISRSPVSMHTRGGEVLTIYFEDENGKFSNVFLEGEARFIYEATLDPEALKT